MSFGAVLARIAWVRLGVQVLPSRSVVPVAELPGVAP